MGDRVDGDVLAFHEVRVEELVLVMRLSGSVQRLCLGGKGRASIVLAGIVVVVVVLYLESTID